MGIRIKKILGYGLTDVIYDKEKWEITDNRFYPKGFAMADSDSKEEKFSDVGFTQYLENIIEDDDNDTFDLFNDTFDLRLLHKLRNDQAIKDGGGWRDANSIFNVMQFDPEFGLDNVMVFIPPIFNEDWSRYNNTIDYYEPHHLDESGNIGTGITLLNRSLYPWEGLVNLKNSPPTRLVDPELSMFNMCKWENFDKLDEYQRKTAKQIGFDSVDEMFNMIQPMIPKELIAALRYLKIFNDEKSIYQLRPMIYWYWG